jgi:phage baseplate assembly protein W
VAHQPVVAVDPREVRFLDYPYGIAAEGAARTTTTGDHLRDLIVQVLFTSPGERVNLPEFGVGVQRLVFAPDSEALRASTQFLVSVNLRRWLGDRIDVERVEVASVPGEEETVTIEIAYVEKRTRERQSLQVRV